MVVCLKPDYRCSLAWRSLEAPHGYAFCNYRKKIGCSNSDLLHGALLHRRGATRVITLLISSSCIFSFPCRLVFSNPPHCLFASCFPVRSEDEYFRQLLGHHKWLASQHHSQHYSQIAPVSLSSMASDMRALRVFFYCANVSCLQCTSSRFLTRIFQCLFSTALLVISIVLCFQSPSIGSSYALPPFFFDRA